MTDPTTEPVVGLNRRTNSGRYISCNRDEFDIESELSSSEFSNYRVQIPSTPDLQPMSNNLDPTVAAQVEEQYVSSSLFTGGFNNVTRSHLMDKVKESDTKHRAQLLDLWSCAVVGCDQKVMEDENGDDIIPCECDFKICIDCFKDAVKNGGICPGCKESYRVDVEETLRKVVDRKKVASVKKTERNNKSSIMRSGRIDIDHNRWLFESKGTYGYGNAIWPGDSNGNDGKSGYLDANKKEFLSKPWRPLTRKLKVPPAVLSPYRLLIAIRMAVLGLFLTWRIHHRNHDAVWLWGMSVVCELWFAFSWLLDQLPKLSPINRATDLSILKEKFETPSPCNPTGKSDLPGIDVFVSTADPEKEPVLVTANTILSILAVDYPVEKLACYVSDDGGALLTFEAMAEAASFASLWVPFCRKHNIEPRNPESYFNQKKDPYMNKVRPDFVKDRRRVKREYDEFKVRVNGLPDSIRRRSNDYNAREELSAMNLQKEADGGAVENVKIPKATWMADGTQWPGTWIHTSDDHSRSNHAGIIQVMLKPASDDPLLGMKNPEEGKDIIDLTETDIRLPMLVYVSREKRPGYDHNKKAGAMNALVRASAVMSNGPFILNLDCDHYIYNSQALREGMCFMLDRGGERLCYVQFPQRFEGIDPSDRYANHNTVFFDINMRALDGLQGPVYVGTGCLFRRIALYGFDPPHHPKQHPSHFCGCCFPRTRNSRIPSSSELQALRTTVEDDTVQRFGNSLYFIDSIPVAELQGRPLADHPSVKHGRHPGSLISPRELLDVSIVAEAINVISCWYEDKTEWGTQVGWIYGSVTEGMVTGYRMHNRGWKSVYCVTKCDAFRGSALINLTDRLHQVLRWATGSVEIFFSRNNAMFASPKMKLLQRIAYLNVGIYPFTSFFLIVYCFLPAFSLFTGKFIVECLSTTFLVYLLAITLTVCMLAILEIKWSKICLEDWWRNEQFWLIGGTSAHLAAVLRGLLKVIAGIEISFTLTTKCGGEDVDDEFADLYTVKWTSLMIPPLTIIMVNLTANIVAVSRTVYSPIPQWSRLIGGTFFSFWVLAHFYPFAKGLMGRRGRMPTIVYVWSGLITITISLIWVTVDPPDGSKPISGMFNL